MTFSDRVKHIVRNIPEGATRTYQQITTAAGNPRAARAVGSVMRKNCDPSIPCHRVVKSDGTVGNYNRGGSMAKAMLLTLERNKETVL
ncbi:MGMT family protein [Candidatus Kaiserbacteria bacterium]|nr:MGMT family protein [Candidatus Kaiserbacteria bacterium]